MNALTTTENKSTDLITFDDEKLELIKRTVAVGATDDELDLFMYQAQKMGLDPLARQIHFQKFTNKKGEANVSFITTIDGYRLIADRTGKYAGSSEPVFGEKFLYKNKKVPSKATVTVKKFVNGHVCDFSGTAHWSEYCPEYRDFMWVRMPCTMLAKCAEAKALRKAFPADLSGVYTADEMEQANVSILTDEVPNKLPPVPYDLHVDESGSEVIIEEGEYTEEAQPAAKSGPRHITQKQLTYLHTLGGEAYEDWKVKGKEVLADMGYSSSKEITLADFNQLVIDLQSVADSKNADAIQDELIPAVKNGAHNQ